MAAAESNVTFDFAICAAKSSIEKVNEARISQIFFSLMVTFIFMLFSCRKFCCYLQNILLSIDTSRKFPSALPENCVSIFIYFASIFFFCIKQANKICILLSLHFSSVRIEFLVLCF